MRRSHHNFLNIGQIKKIVKKHHFFMGNNNLERNKKIGAKEILMLFYL